MPDFFVQHLWPGLAIVVALYISDYTFTLVCARLYQNGGREKIVFEGSFELNPYYESDIDSLRRVSPRFLRALLLIAAILSIVWRLALQSEPAGYEFILGFFVLIQLSIHKRHLVNLIIFRAAATDAMRGRIEYSRKLTLRLSSVDQLLFAVLYLILFAFTRSWFVLGGALGCLAIANQHGNLARKHETALATAGEAAEEVTVR